MTKAEFKDWLERQEVPIEETVTLDRYQDYLRRELGLRGGSIDAAAEIWRSKYEDLPRYGIRIIEYEVEYRGVRYDVTRAVITGMPGLWGREETYRIAAERAAEALDWDAFNRFMRLLREMEEQPEYRKWRYRRL